MGVYYKLHCEAKRDNQWQNIDFYTFDHTGNYNIVPIMEGRSFVGAALRLYGLMDESITREKLAEKTLEAYPTDHPEWQEWRVFNYSKFFANKDFSGPEYSGYMARDVMNTYRAEKDIDILTAATYTDSFLTPAQYAALTPEAQRGFEWCEFTDTFGTHNAMHGIQQAVEMRLQASKVPADTPVRIVIHIS